MSVLISSFIPLSTLPPVHTSISYAASLFLQMGSSVHAVCVLIKLFFSSWFTSRGEQIDSLLDLFL